ncbi:MAG: hypothetical protein Q7K28_03295 [Candidatus Wildermuthbacteria bacterium]|nr:hypothetical protein [Candidatus Wildermuthbacteria bacterium]
MSVQTPTIQIPLSLEQIAIALKQLPPEKLEDLELMLDKKFQRLILRRGKTAWREYQTGKTISLSNLKKEFSR